MKRNINDIPIHATSLEGVDTGSLFQRVLVSVPTGKALRIPFTSSRSIMIGVTGPVGMAQAVIFATGYNPGGAARISFSRLNSSSEYAPSVYVNGSSEEGCIYVKNDTGSVTLSMGLVPIIGSVMYSVVDDIPQDATLVSYKGALTGTSAAALIEDQSIPIIMENKNNQTLFSENQRIGGGGISEV